MEASESAAVPDSGIDHIDPESLKRLEDEEMSQEKIVID